MPVKRSFAPVVDANVRLLILGSLPGEISLAQNRYYANPQNQFWRLVGEVIGIDLHGKEYERRLQTLLKNGIGLWDVIAHATRPGSLDSAIRQHAGNDLEALLGELPKLRGIAFNGGTAAKIGVKQLGARAQDYRIFKLPSSSPAHTLPFSEKLAAWEELRKVVGRPPHDSA